MRSGRGASTGVALPKAKRSTKVGVRRGTITDVALAQLGTPPAQLTPGMLEARQAAARRGWTGRQWVALWTLVNRESAWDSNAQNPTSTAYGRFQFLDSTWSTVGAKKTSDPTRQLRAGLDYIAQRYGTPEKAWSFWWHQDDDGKGHWY
jgi:hypothetical protein